MQCKRRRAERTELTCRCVGIPKAGNEHNMERSVPNIAWSSRMERYVTNDVGMPLPKMARYTALRASL